MPTMWLTEQLGPDAVAKVRYWIRYRFCTGGENPWLAYEDALSSWAANLRIKGADEIGLLADPRRIEQHFRHITRNGDLRPKLMAGAHEATSIWDLSLFEDRGSDETPRDSKFFPFIDDFLVAINMTAFQSFWAWLIAEVTEVDLYSIERFVKEKASKQGADFCSAAALPRL